MGALEFETKKSSTPAPFSSKVPPAEVLHGAVSDSVGRGASGSVEASATGPAMSSLHGVQDGLGGSGTGALSGAVTLFAKMYGVPHAGEAAPELPGSQAGASLHNGFSAGFTQLSGLLGWARTLFPSGGAMNAPGPAATPAPTHHPTDGAPSTLPAPAASPTAPTTDTTPKPAPAPDSTSAPSPTVLQSPGGDPKTPQQVADAVAHSQENLTTGFLNPVTKEEARDAMNTMLRLPPELQGGAIEKLDPDSFGRLLSTVPEAEREQFKALVDNTHDPERKLRLWAEYHKSKVANDAAKEKEKTKDEGGFFSQSAEQKENQKKNEQRDEIVKSTKSEVDEETAFLLDKVKAGKLSEADLSKYMAAKDAEHQGELKDNKEIHGTLDGLSDQDRVEFVAKHAEKKLARGFLDPVTDAEAGNALDTIKTLPPALQGKVVERMDHGAFERLVSEVPDDQREQFDTLMKNTHDPERKLKLWGEYHKAEVKHDAKKEKEKTADEGGFFSQTATQKENERLNDRRDKIVKSTRTEVDDEVEFLLKKSQSGGLTEAEVDKLSQRKEHEHQIEMKYNVNLVNDQGARSSNGSKIAWTDDELTAIESGLARMPKSHVTGNKLLKEIRRSDMQGEDKDKLAKDPNYRPHVGGDHNDGVIRIYDLGVNGIYRHTGDTRQMADPRIMPAAGPTLSPLEETIVHEFGHDIHDQNPEAFKHFQQAAGWQSGFDSDDLANKGLTEQQIKDLKDKKVADVVVDGRRYVLDPYSKGLFGGARFLSSDDGAIPTLASGAATNPANVALGLSGDTWDYARTNYKDHFAETYQKAIHTPEKLAHDLLDAPQQRANSLTMQRDAKKTALEALKTRQPPPSPAEQQAVQTSFDDAQKQLDDAQRDQGAQRQQFDIMRNEVFHTDQATATTAQRLRDKGVPPDKVQEFLDKAARASTPEQIDFIAQGY